MEKKEVKYPNLVAEMAKNGDKQKTLVKLLESTPATICNKLSGKANWTLREVDIICDYYKKDYYTLFK